VPQIFLSLVVLASVYMSGGTLADFDDIYSLQQSKLIYSTGSFWDITLQRYYDWTINYGFLNMFMFIISVLPLMMIGVGAAKLKIVERAASLKNQLLIFTLSCIPLGIALKLIPFYTEVSVSMQYVQDVLGGPILGLGYIGIILLLTNYKKVQQV